mgnify:FL=1
MTPVNAIPSEVTPKQLAKVLAADKNLLARVIANAPGELVEQLFVNSGLHVTQTASSILLVRNEDQNVEVQVTHPDSESAVAPKSTISTNQNHIDNCPVQAPFVNKKGSSVHRAAKNSVTNSSRQSEKAGMHTPENNTKRDQEAKGATASSHRTQINSNGDQKSVNSHYFTDVCDQHSRGQSIQHHSFAPRELHASSLKAPPRREPPVKLRLKTSWKSSDSTSHPDHVPKPSAPPAPQASHSEPVTSTSALAKPNDRPNYNDWRTDAYSKAEPLRHVPAPPIPSRATGLSFSDALKGKPFPRSSSPGVSRVEESAQRPNTYNQSLENGRLVISKTRLRGNAVDKSAKTVETRTLRSGPDGLVEGKVPPWRGSSWSKRGGHQELSCPPVSGHAGHSRGPSTSSRQSCHSEHPGTARESL